MVKDWNKPKPKAGRFSVDKVPGLGYFVFSPDGKRVSGPTNRDHALLSRDHHQRIFDQKAKRGPRKCLCCGQEFESEGAHNRMCNRCRLLGDEVPSYRYINPRRRTG